jgi:hypothetical protein
VDVLYASCCELDLHKKTVVASLIHSDERPPPMYTTQTFQTMTADLLAQGCRLYPRHYGKHRGLYMAPASPLLSAFYAHLHQRNSCMNATC